MRWAAVSVLSIFACLSAFANARLPIVNVGAGSVSARAAFGESVENTFAKVEVAPVSRTRPAAVKASGDDAWIASMGSGENRTGARGDVLAPRKPRGDLWARMEKPLRLPEPQEISVIRSDSNLPEEYIDAPKTVARASIPVRDVSDKPMVAGHAGDMDAEIAKLVDLQRKADESVRVSAARPSTISSYDIRPAVVARTAPRPEVRERPTADDVSLRRVVIPMEEDVIARPVRKAGESKFASDDEIEMSKMSPGELKKAFKKTYLSENKHLSTYKMDDRFDVASDLTSAMEGFTSSRDLSETGGVRPLEIKIGFRGDDSALSRDNYNLLSEYAGIIVSNPKRAIQIAIPERATRSLDNRKLAARRLAIVEQVLRDTGVSDQRIMPVLAQRSDDSFVLRVISSDQFETMTQQKRDMFGDTVGKKTYKSMTW
jgi:hypothetical protein